jgi:hypothetical protein
MTKKLWRGEDQSAIGRGRQAVDPLPLRRVSDQNRQAYSSFLKLKAHQDASGIVDTPYRRPGSQLD